MSGISPTNYHFSLGMPEVQPGKYLVIDPCYVIGEDPFWSDFCTFCFPEEAKGCGHNVVITHIDNHNIIIFSTAFGDGCYPVGDGHNFGTAGVDAGCLSLIPMAFVEEHDLDTSLGVEVEIDEAGIPTYDEGNFFLNNLEVLTNEKEEDEDEEEEW